MQGAGSKIVYAVALLLAAAPGVGGAQNWRTAESSQGLMTRYGEYLLLGGGVTDFTEDALKDGFDVGTTWDLRVGFGSRFFVGAEAAYVGSFRGADGPGSDVLTNGAEGVIRLQYPYVRGAWLIEPFAFGGLGFSRLSVRDAPPGVEDSDDLGVVPFGAGLTLGYGRFLVDARFTYRSTFAEDLQVAGAGGSPSLDQWAVGASIGYEF
jgi:hypothetical protein